VAKKKHEPKIPSAKEKDENLYSNACKEVKSKANKRVTIKGIITLVLNCLAIKL
jgi:predicted nucleic acid-binding Zn ribbon protein